MTSVRNGNPTYVFRTGIIMELRCLRGRRSGLSFITTLTSTKILGQWKEKRWLSEVHKKSFVISSTGNRYSSPRPDKIRTEISADTRESTESRWETRVAWTKVFREKSLNLWNVCENAGEQLRAVDLLIHPNLPPKTARFSLKRFSFSSLHVAIFTNTITSKWFSPFELLLYWMSALLLIVRFSTSLLSFVYRWTKSTFTKKNSSDTRC